MEVEEEQLKVTEQLNCKLTKQHVPIGVILKKVNKLGGKMIGDSWKKPTYSCSLRQHSDINETTGKRYARELC